MKFSAFVGEGTTYLSANNICCLILIMRFEQGALTPCSELQSQNATENPSSATKERKPVNGILLVNLQGSLSPCLTPVNDQMRLNA